MKLDPINHPTLPLPDSDGNNNTAETAANLIRHKLDNLYSLEPDAVTETIESSQAAAGSRSKHQKFMIELAASGKPFAQIQTDWHEYYAGLSNSEKHQVWQEFYDVQNRSHAAPAPQVPEPLLPGENSAVTGNFEQHFVPPPKLRIKKSSVADLKQQITGRVQSRSKLSRKAHVQSMLFGLSAGAFVVLMLMFSFFNERVIAPFITPSRNVSSTPLILDPSSAAVGSESKLIIPKINVEVPVVYDVETIEEAAVQKGLESGVVHYATTSNPGEQGNGAIFGHSSNNILNRGKYKFAFVLLSRLESGDTFYIEKGGVRYVYKIFEKKVVSPTDVSVLGSINGKPSTLSLITCDPPGTTINRLVVIGEQISPDPAGNIASTATQTDEQAEILAGNPQSLWSRIWGNIF
ncbi:class D sortase [Candidatus Saccharibacteria bacterium]|nr:class D sortase [Candidatus Saccharibacteria bacterium]